MVNLSWLRPFSLAISPFKTWCLWGTPIGKNIFWVLNETKVSLKHFNFKWISLFLILKCNDIKLLIDS